MRALLSLTLLWTLAVLPACEAEEAPAPTYTSVFPDGSVFADGQLILPDGHVCIGVEPPESAYLASPGPVADVQPEGRPDGDVASEEPSEPDDAGPSAPDLPELEEDPCAASPGTCLGAEAPLWALEDFQPQSCGYEAVYGLDTLKSRPTVAVLLAAW